MATRLDRLWILLDTGSTPVTRKAAAEQIGEVQKLHPHELHNLLKKTQYYLRNKSWDTRVAAAQTIAAIAKNVKPWDPLFQLRDDNAEDDNGLPNDGLAFDTFDISKVLKHGTPLLASAGNEYSAHDEGDNVVGKMSEKERVSFYRQQLQQKLGLVAQGKVFSTGIEKLFDDEDLVLKKEDEVSAVPVKDQHAVKELAALGKVSAREKLAAKRRAKQQARQALKQKEKNTESVEPPSKRSRLSVSEATEDEEMTTEEFSVDDNITEERTDWPFTVFCEELFKDLFDPVWEVRHGVAMALREVIKLHGNTAGISVHTPPNKRAAVTQTWLEDASIRLLCVLALDRFADFVTDELVAPVRATSAQVLGVLLDLIEATKVQEVVKLLMVLSQQSSWEVRHAALLGIQHLLAVRQEDANIFLPMVMPAILNGLRDQYDDVRAIAAASLLPVAKQLPTLLPEKLMSVMGILWDSLLELDELSASTNSVMELLSILVVVLNDKSVASEAKGLIGSLDTMVTRLWPFLSHNISSVRHSCVKTLLALLTGDVGAADKSASCPWLPAILQELLCHTFQRMLVEPEEPVRLFLWQVYQSAVSCSTAIDLAAVTSPWIPAWLQLLVHSPTDQPLPHGLLVASAASRCGLSAKATAVDASSVSMVYIGGAAAGVELPADREETVMKCRVLGARAIGYLAVILSQTTQQQLVTELLNSLAQLLLQLVSSNTATHKMVASLIISYYAADVTKVAEPLLVVQTHLNTIITEQSLYSDVVQLLMNLQKECQVLVTALQGKGLKVSSIQQPQQSGMVFNVDTARDLVNNDYQQLTNLELTPTEQEEFELKKRNVLAALGQLQEENQRIHTKVHCCIAGAIISLRTLPTKLNPIIRPIMDSIKLENDPTLQQQAGSWLCVLLELCKDRVPCPNPKIIKNLCQFLCADSSHTPPVMLSASQQAREGVELWTWNVGIITLTNHQSKTSQPHPQRGPKKALQLPKEVEAVEDDKQILSDDTAAGQHIQRRGAVVTIGKLAEHFRDNLFATLPNLWAAIVQPLEVLPEKCESALSEQVVASVTAVLHALQVFEVVIPVVPACLQAQVLSVLPKLLSCGVSPFTAIRHMTARCIAVMATANVHSVMKFVISEVIPQMGDASSATNRQGAIEIIACLLDRAGLSILCYAVLLVMPTLGRMSDQDTYVRLMASHCFANLVTLIAMEAGVESPVEMCDDLKERRIKEREFLEQLLDTSKLTQYKIPTIVKAELRKYQQDGINWLAFLNRYNLHGILCDDMGLGKTLQAICIVAGDYQTRKERYKATKDADCKPLPSLVVCPPTLTPHWHYEVNKFIKSKHFTTLQYVGGPQERQMLQARVSKHSLVIASYDIVRNDVEFFSKINWNYCILDEGHIIKNSKTKITKAVKQLRANHRLILSGTPVQNNVLELWSLFDFLLPGFLGTQRQFNERFGKPILLSRYAKSSSKEQEAGVLAMETLHKQVLPFVLRRLKEDVLDDLPPKIIQDYYCDLSPLQVELYEDFSRSQARKEVDNVLMVEPDQPQTSVPAQQTHVFQALQYLRKVCNHPLLVLNEKHPLYSRIVARIGPNGMTHIEHAAKLVALKHLLHECGIGVVQDVGEGDLTSSTTTAAAVCQHRVLVFCQIKSMLDIIEEHLFKAQMSSVTYLRLDGSLPLNQRFKIVTRFNNDPSIDVLLLTTQVGGLGLNLTGADTVVFFEHDWNPMRDLQAMDRAHRIGQKKVVNVYRLVTRGTLEEKIMNLQQFKLNIANTVINQDNSSLLSMDTSQMLDLFNLGGGAAPAGDNTASSKPIKPGLKGMLENLTELWDESQYESELNLTTFMQSLGKH